MATPALLVPRLTPKHKTRVYVPRLKTHLQTHLQTHLETHLQTQRTGLETHLETQVKTQNRVSAFRKHSV